MIIKSIDYPGYKIKAGEQLEMNAPLVTSNNVYVGGQPLTMGGIGGYVTTGAYVGSTGQVTGFGAQTVRECFPKEWNITSVTVTSSGYGHTSVELKVNGQYDYDAVNTFWQSRLYSRHSSWSPEGGQVTTFGYNIQIGDDLNALHKEVFDEEFIKDFEEVDK